MLRSLSSGRLGAVAAVCVTLGFAAFGYADDVVIGNFENGSLDGWQAPPNQGGNPTLASVPGSTTTPPSNTLGDGVLQVNIGSNAFWGANSVNLIGTPELRTAFLNATAVSFDLTILANQLNGGASGGFTGYAQSNEMALNGNAANSFSQHAFSTTSGDSDSMNLNAQWSGTDGTRTLTYKLSNFTLNDPTTGTPETYQQFVANHPEVTDVRFWFVTQFGAGNAASAGDFYFDNVRLMGVSVPEPATLGLVGLAACGFLRRRGA